MTGRGAEPAPVGRVGMATVGPMWWWVAAGLYALGIFFFSSQPYPFGIRRLPFVVDKVIHVLVYGLFSGVLFAALRQSRPRTSLLLISGFALTVTVLYGLSDEYHQSFVPHRRLDVYDLMADAVGAFLAQCAVLWAGHGH